MIKSVFAALLGSANVGKSTLLNAMVGEKIAIVTKKPQTTRNRITGIRTEEDFQIVFTDTPGIHAPKDKLGEYMVKTAESAAEDVDIIVFVVDAKTGARERDRGALHRLPAGVPALIALNKTDAVDSARAAEVEDSLKEYALPVLRISARTGEGLDALLERIRAYAREGPMFYPGDMRTDQPQGLRLAEVIREKALKGIGKEIPHGIGVEIERLEREEAQNLYRVSAVIYAERESHKGIIIGAGGAKLKKIGSAARVDMEAALGGKVFLQLWVKVKPDWRNKTGMLRNLGYE